MSVVCQINFVGGITCGPRACSKSFLTVKSVTPVLFISYILEKWFSLWGERAHSLKLFCMYDKRFEISKTK